MVAAHDAGGAEVVSSWLRTAAGGDYRQVDFLLAGPAVKVFGTKLPVVALLAETRALNGIAGYDRVLTGTSWGSTLERRVIAAAKAAGVKVAAYLDHWINYRERFLLDGALTLPDELWAGDEYAYKLAREIFPTATVVLEPNRYFSDAVAAVAAVEAVAVPPRRGDEPRVLYVCEPRTMNYGQPDYWGYDEYAALAGYLAYLAGQGSVVEEVRVRLHPAESPGKYAAVTNRFAAALPLTESGGAPLSADCAWADWVVGCDSMAMAIALLAGKKVFSCIPPGGRAMTLPFPAIIRLFASNE